MALQIGGQISLSNISGEMGLIKSNVSLGKMSTHSTLNHQSPMRPNEIPPHNISEFYGYDHNYSSFKPITGGPKNSNRGKWFAACGDKADTFYAHDGEEDLPTVGDMFFINEKGQYNPVTDAHVKVEHPEKITITMIVTTDREAIIVDVNSCDGLEEPQDPKDPGVGEPVDEEPRDPRLDGRR